jgi:hypothetical protein
MTPLDRAHHALRVAHEYVDAYRQGKDHPLGVEGAEELMKHIEVLTCNTQSPRDPSRLRWYQRLPRPVVSCTFKWERRWPLFACGFVGRREFIFVAWVLFVSLKVGD